MNQQAANRCISHWRRFRRRERAFFVIASLSMTAWMSASAFTGEFHGLFVSGGTLLVIHFLYRNPEFVRQDVRNDSSDPSDLDGLEFFWLGIVMVAGAALVL